MTDAKVKPTASGVKRRSKEYLARKRNSKQEINDAAISAKQTKQAKPKEPKPPQFIRLTVIWLILLAGAVALGWRLYQLQIVQGVLLEKRARQQQTESISPYIPRRSIIDSQNNVLATDKLVYSLYVHPKLFKITRQEMATKLAEILDNKTSAELFKQFSEQETGIQVDYALKEALAEKIRQLSLDGVELIQHYARFYPQEEMVSEAIGYVDREHQGQAGLELSQQSLLQRSLTDFPIRRAGNGMFIPANLPEGLLKFDDLQLKLSIDLRLQRAARSALREKMKEFKAKRGAVIVMDVKDGSLLVLACEPTYDPNRYFDYSIERFKNWTVSDLYEPGSTFKSINLAIAIGAKIITPNTRIYDSGMVRVDGWNLFNSTKKGYGNISIAEVLQNSSNVGMVQIMKRMDRKQYYHHLQQLGIAQKVGVDLPGDIDGYLKSEEIFTGRAIEAAVTAFGQGLSLTPLKMVQLNAAIANGGKLVTPHVVQGLVDPGGEFHWRPTHITKTVFSPETSRTVLEMMESVVEKGSGKAAQIEAYRIAGKTGTAQKASPRGGYLSNAKITSFVAILPVEAPRYVVLALIDEPKGGNTFGSTVAAPMAKSVMEAVIALKGIPPSKPIKPQKKAIKN